MRKSPAKAPARPSAPRSAPRALRRRAATALRRRRDVRRRGTPDDVHDLRVAGRRLQEAIDLLAFALPARERLRARRRVKRIRRSLTGVRDADVQVALVESLAGRLGPAAAAPLAPLRAQLRARAAAARDALRREGEGLSVRGLRPRLGALLKQLPPIPRRALVAATRAALRRRAAEVARARVRALGGGAREMHALRIAVKKYRYTLEFMEEIGLGRHGTALVEARRLQETLGCLHDLDLLLALGRRAPGRAAPGVTALLRRERRPVLEAARALVAAFVPKRPGRSRGAARGVAA